MPKKDAAQTNFNFKSDVEELDGYLQQKKVLDDHMSRMNLVKLHSMVDNLRMKLGFVNKKISTE